MPDRTRPVRKEICLNEQELNLIRHKMRQLGTRNFGAYARKMLIDGYIIKVDYVFESLARSLLPVIQEYYESEDGKMAFAEWKATKQASYKTPT